MGKILDSYRQWIHDRVGLSPTIQSHIIETIIIVVIISVLRFVLLNIFYRQVKDTRKRYRWRKIITYTLTIIGIFLVGRVWFTGFQSVATFIGIFAAGIAIALQDLIINIAGWLFIMWRRPFDVGDRIEIGGHAGDVIDKRLFMFTLMEIGQWVDAEQSTGRIIHLPNGWVFKNSLANYSKGFSYIWNEVPVLVTFESNWEKAKKILLGIAQKHAEYLSNRAEERVKRAAKKYMIFYTKLTPIVWTSVKDSGILLTVRYLCDPRKRRTTEQAIWEDVLREFAANDDIDFAYPTTRFYDNRLEGKTGTKSTK